MTNSKSLSLFCGNSLIILILNCDFTIDTHNYGSFYFLGASGRFRQNRVKFKFIIKGATLVLQANTRDWKRKIEPIKIEILNVLLRNETKI